MEKWKQAAADGDVVIIHKPSEKSENPYLPFVGKYNMVVSHLYTFLLPDTIICFTDKEPNNRLLYYLKHNKMHVPFSKTVLLVNN